MSDFNALVLAIMWAIIMLVAVGAGVLLRLLIARRGHPVRDPLGGHGRRAAAGRISRRPGPRG